MAFSRRPTACEAFSASRLTSGSRLSRAMRCTALPTSCSSASVESLEAGREFLVPVMQTVYLGDISGRPF